MEYYEDEFEQNRLEAYKDDDGEYFLGDSGDPLIDKWEDELKKGIDPDLTEGMSEASLEKLKKEKQKYEKAKELSKEVDNINETFTLGNSRYDSKYEPRGAYSGKNIVGKKDPRAPKLLGEDD